MSLRASYKKCYNMRVLNVYGFQKLLFHFMNKILLKILVIIIYGNQQHTLSHFIIPSTGK